MGTTNKDFLNQNKLKLILILISLHSIAVGTGLIFVPGKLFSFFGLAIPTEKFFSVQGGVFHYVMAIAYFMGAKWHDRYNGIIQFSIIAKLMGALFLTIFYFLVEQAWIILFSGIIDLLMGLGILWSYFDSQWDFNKMDLEFTGFDFSP